MQNLTYVIIKLGKNTAAQDNLQIFLKVTHTACRDQDIEN